jgi:hypothetical protein
MPLAHQTEGGELPDDQSRSRDTDRYWVAIRGPAVPSWPHPVDEPTMRRAIVWVGSHGEETMWLFVPEGESTADLGPSNYELLIGYRTPAAQHAGIDLLLRGSHAEMITEAKRAVKEETVIFGGGIRGTADDDREMG